MKNANQVKFSLHGTSMEWRVNTPQLLKEIFDNNPLGGVFFQPINIFREILIEVADRATEINDPVLNALMCRLALYGESDPYDKKNYNQNMLDKCLSHPEYKEYKRKKYATKKATE